MKNIQLSFWKNIFPEVLATVIIAVTWAGRFDFSFAFLLFFSSSILLRLVWNSAIIIHGLGHTIFIAIVDEQLNALNLTNIFENRSIAKVLRSLFPFGSIFIPGCDRVSPWVAAGDPTPWRIKIKAMGGICCNFLAILILLQLLPNSFSQFWIEDSGLAPPIIAFLSQTFFSANLLIIFTSWSDIAASVAGKAEIFNCGVCGLIALLNIAEDPNKLLPKWCREILSELLKDTKPRGVQSGGINVMAINQYSQNCFVGIKKVFSKREYNPTENLLDGFITRLKGNKRRRILNIIAHLRYSTSKSSQSESEAHPHGWLGSRKEYIWENHKGIWKKECRNVCNLIAHNGDFEGVTLSCGFWTHEESGWWLNRVLHTNNCTKGDSPKLAGFVDLYRTKGSWYASTRLGKQLAESSFKAAFGGGKVAADSSNEAPSKEKIRKLAAIFEKCFDDSDKPSSARPDLHYCSQLKEKVLSAIVNESTMRDVSLEQRAAFVTATIKAFFLNDLLTAVKEIMLIGKGTLGLAVVSTLEKGSAVLCAKGQPMNVGFNFEGKYMVYGSTTKAVSLVLRHSDSPYSCCLSLEEYGEIALATAQNIEVYSIGQTGQLVKSDLTHRWVKKDNPLLRHAFS